MPRPAGGAWRTATLYTVGLWAFVLAIYMPIIYSHHVGDAVGIAVDSSTVILSVVFALPLFALLRAVERWPLAPRLVMLAAGVVVAAVIQTAFDITLSLLLSEHVMPRWGRVQTSLARSYAWLFNYLCVFGTNMVIFNLVASRDRDAEQQRALAEARSAAHHAQLAALRFQINPHFLFNTLNAISALIVTRRNDQAEMMTARLSSFLRASLASDPQELISLEDELGTVGDYLEIESVRFGDRLVPVIDCEPEALDVLVPSFILQPLVENAVKYGVAHARRSVRISVAARVEAAELVVAIEDNGPCLPEGATPPVGTGTGLRNVRERLQAVYGARARLSAARGEACFVATIRLPARRRPG